MEDLCVIISHMIAITNACHNRTNKDMSHAPWREADRLMTQKACRQARTHAQDLNSEDLEREAAYHCSSLDTAQKTEATRDTWLWQPREMTQTFISILTCALTILQKL